MRKYSIQISVVILILSMCFCALGQGAITINSNPVTLPVEEGIGPYNFTERDRELLRKYNMDWFNAPMISYKAPEEAKKMDFSFYQYRDGVWQEWKQSMGIEIPDDMPDAVPFEGTIALKIQSDDKNRDYWMDIYVNDDNCGASTRCDFSALIDFDVMAYGGYHLEEYQTIELGKPVPIAMMVYNDESYLTDVGTLQEHFEPEAVQYFDTELAVALMVTFTE